MVLNFFSSLENPFLISILAACAAIFSALLIYRVLRLFLLSDLFKKYPDAQIFIQNSTLPLRLLLIALALQIVFAIPVFEPPGLALLRHSILLLLVTASTWLVVRLLNHIHQIALQRYADSFEDNLAIRPIRTKITVLIRILSGVCVIFGIATALMTFPAVRQLGASLLASAGLLGLIFGIAAKPVLSNLIAGLQIAMAQLVRIGDVVVIEDKWGRIEEITGAYIVIKIWDERRLIVPLQWLIEHPFQNWTRKTTEITGSIFIWVDYCLPLEPLRDELNRLCQSAPEWDGRVCILQVTDCSERAMQIRILVSSANSGKNWDLRCRIREGLIIFLQQKFPQFLPHQRIKLSHQE